MLFSSASSVWVRRLVAPLGAAALAVGLLPPASAAVFGPVSVSPAGDADRGLSSWACESARGDARDVVSVSSGVRPRVSFVDGWTADASRSWLQVNDGNGSLTLGFLALGWVVPSLSASAGDVSLAVERVLDFHREVPDVGSRKMAGGWSESATAKRIRVVDCLYQVSGDRRLVPVAEQLAGAVMDPKRYYGPPRFPAHNHGVMADRALLAAADTFGRSDWARVGVDRLRAQLELTFDSCGLVAEQASSYQHFNADLWGDVAARVRPFDSALAARVERAAADARVMADLLTFPDGEVPIIGDGRPKVGPVFVPGNDVTWCAETGWGVVERLSGAGVSQHGLVRFGPGTRFHGHADKGSFTWWAGRGSSGVPVVTDRGLFGKEKGARLDYARGPLAHSTLLWAGGSDVALDGRVRELSRGRVRAVLDADVKAGSWRRVLEFKRGSRPVVTVRDRVSGSAAGDGATQLFPLDPAWRAVSVNASAGEFVTRDGWRLKVSCSARGAGAVLGVEQVEHFEDYGVAVPALTVSCAAAGGKRVDVRSVLRVFPPA